MYSPIHDVYQIMGFNWVWFQFPNNFFDIYSKLQQIKGYNLGLIVPLDAERIQGGSAPLYRVKRGATSPLYRTQSYHTFKIWNWWVQEPKKISLRGGGQNNISPPQI